MLSQREARFDVHPARLGEGVRDVQDCQQQNRPFYVC